MSGRDGRIGWIEDMKAGERWSLLSKKHKPTQRNRKIIHSIQEILKKIKMETFSRALNDRLRTLNISLYPVST